MYILKALSLFLIDQNFAYVQFLKYCTLDFSIKFKHIVALNLIVLKRI